MDDTLPDIQIRMLHVSLYWHCGHNTDHGPDDVPRYCPVCCGTNLIKARITEGLRPCTD